MYSVGLWEETSHGHVSLVVVSSLACAGTGMTSESISWFPLSLKPLGWLCRSSKNIRRDKLCCVKVVDKKGVPRCQAKHLVTSC